MPLSLVSLQKDLEALKKEVGKTNIRVTEVEDRVTKSEARLDEVEKKLAVIVDDLTDIKRQSSKICVVLGGSDLPPRSTGENTMNIFCEAVEEKYGIRINKREDLATVHRRAKGDIIAKFVKTSPGSNFDRLAHRRGAGNRNPLPELKIFANILLSQFDDKVRYYASLAKKCGVIYFYEVLHSGKIGVLIDDAKKPGEKKMFTITKASDVKVILTEAVVKMIKIRPTKNKKSPNQANIRGDQEDEEMDIALLNDPATEDTTTS